jgi:hypothetical protein
LADALGVVECAFATFDQIADAAASNEAAASRRSGRRRRTCDRRPCTKVQFHYVNNTKV